MNPYRQLVHGHTAPGISGWLLPDPKTAPILTTVIRRDDHPGIGLAPPIEQKTSASGESGGMPWGMIAIAGVIAWMIFGFGQK